MRLLLSLLFLPLLVLSSTKIEDFDENIYKAFNDSFSTISVPGAALFQSNGTSFKFSVYGYNDLESWQTLNDSSKFVLGSLSELIIARQMLHYVDQGKLSLTDSIKKFIPKISHDFIIGDLMSHRAGLEFSRVDSYSSNSDLVSIELLVEKIPKKFVEDQHNVFTPNPANYLLLSRIIEIIENVQFESYLNNLGFEVYKQDIPLFMGSFSVPYFSMLKLNFTSKLWPATRVVAEPDLWCEFLENLIFNQKTSKFTNLSEKTFNLTFSLNTTNFPQNSVVFENWMLYNGQFLGHLNSADDLTPTDALLLKFNDNWVSLLTNFVENQKLIYQQNSLSNVFIQNYLIETTDFPVNITDPWNNSSEQEVVKRASQINGKWYPSRYERGFLASMNPTIYIANQKELLYIAYGSGKYPSSGLIEFAENLFLQRNVSSSEAPRWQIYATKEVVMMNGVITLIQSSPFNEFVLSSVFFSIAPFIYIISVITACYKGQTRELEEGVPDSLLVKNKTYFSFQFILLFLSMILSASVYYLISYAQRTVGNIPLAYFKCPEKILTTAAAFSYISAVLAAILVMVTFARVYVMKRHVSSCLNCWLTLFAIFIMIYTAWGAINGTWEASCLKI